MPPLFSRSFDTGLAAQALSNPWQSPGDIFSVLLLLGGDVINRALAQITGSCFTPVAFSFGTAPKSIPRHIHYRGYERLTLPIIGWVAYAVNAVVTAIGQNELLPPNDCPCLVVSSKTGYIRENRSWILSRIVGDFESWQHRSVRTKVQEMLDAKWREIKERNRKNLPSSAQIFERPTQAGLCIAIYHAKAAKIGCPGYDAIYFSGIATMLLQLVIAAIPLGLFGDWNILLITICGTIFSLTIGALTQWKKEKWACREKSNGTFILTRGNSSQYAIVVLSESQGFNLEDLAGGSLTIDAFTSLTTRLIVIVIATLWILLLITAAGITTNTWFLLAVGGVGTLQNMYTAGASRDPAAFGMPLVFGRVIGKTKVMDAIYAVEKELPGVGRNLVQIFFPGGLLEKEKDQWARLASKS